MKKYIIIGVIIFFVVLIVMFIFKSFPKKVEIGEFKSFHFSYSNGYAMYSNVSYDVACDDVCTATIKPYEVSDKDATIIDLTEEDINQLINILIKYDVNKWNGFKKSDKNVLDGDSFSLYMKMKNGDYLSASGYMKWPKGYSSVCGELDAFFSKYVNDEVVLK